MDRRGGESRETNRDIFCPPGLRGTVSDPFARRRVDPLPGRTSRMPDRVSTLKVPESTSVNSSNSGVCPGSAQPSGLFIRARLIRWSRVLTRPKISSIRLGRLPAASTIEGMGINSAIGPPETSPGTVPPSPPAFPRAQCASVAFANLAGRCKKKVGIKVRLKANSITHIMTSKLTTNACF